VTSFYTWIADLAQRGWLPSDFQYPFLIRGFLSVLDIERRSHELLVQSFHLFDDSLMVIKTQGIFEVARG